MNIHFLNCFTCNARVPSNWRTGTLCLLVESNQRLVLVDTGPGQDDYIHPPSIIRIFQMIFKVPLNPQEAAVRQVTSLGYKPEDVKHIILSHMHFDHCGGLRDFPHARVHVHQREYNAFLGLPRRFTDLACVRRHISHQPEFIFYSECGDNWMNFPAIRLPFQPEMWLIPLYGHTHGHCGVVVRTGNTWLFHVADAAPIGLEAYAPRWLVRLILGSHAPCLQAFKSAHPDVQVTTGHMWLDFFEGNLLLQ